MKFKVGDIVKVKDGLNVDNQYGKFYFVSEMDTFKNEKLTIESINNNNGTYHIKEDANRYDWTDEMLEECPERADQKNNSNSSNSFEKLFSNFGKMFDNPQLLTASYGKLINQKNEKIQELEDKINDEESKTILPVVIKKQSIFYRIINKLKRIFKI